MEDFSLKPEAKGSIRRTSETGQCPKVSKCRDENMRDRYTETVQSIGVTRTKV